MIRVKEVDENGCLVVSTKITYPRCGLEKTDCDDTIMFEGIAYCDVWDGEFSDCPYDPEEVSMYTDFPIPGLDPIKEVVQWLMQR